MIVEVHRDGRVTIDGVVVARTNNPQEVLKRLLSRKIDGLVLTGRARWSWRASSRRHYTDHCQVLTWGLQPQTPAAPPA